jgi:hypothetical protein
MKEEKMSDTLNRRHFIQSLLIFLGAGASIKSKLIFASKPDKNLKEKEEKMNAITKRRLSAPCGLDCFNCEIYEENITGEMKKQFALKIRKDPEEVPCKGCRLENGCKHLGQPCETLKCIKDKKLEFCFQCEEFPCVKLQPAKDGADRFPHNYKLFNLCRMKAVGVEKWAEEEAKLIRQRYFLGKFIPGTGPILKG